MSLDLLTAGAVAQTGGASTLTRSTCPYCGTGCGVLIETVGHQIVHVRGDPDHPANAGKLCTKGSTLHLTAAAHIATQTRLLQPMQRLRRGDAPQALGWDPAMEMAAGRLADIVHTHGPDAVGFYGSGQLLTEDYYVLNKLVKGLLGTNNLDTNSRLCMSSAVAGYKATLGADAPPACYDDIDLAQTIFIVGSNAAWAHPILFRRIEAARLARPSQKLIVADPRYTETAEMADLFLPIHPGTDVALFHGLLNVMVRDGQLDTAFIAQHTQGFETLLAVVQAYEPAAVAETCGIPLADLLQAARWMSGNTPTLSLYCQGLNQSSQGTDKNAALINLHLATGQIGKPGAGPFSLTGQPNAMGGREVGGMSNLLSGHRDLSNAAHREEVAQLWGVDAVPQQPGKSAVEMFEAAACGEVKALWIACTNPAQSLPDQNTVRRALERAELVVVQEAYAGTATCQYADFLLPATTWGEKEGTVTNSERRISRVRAALPPAGQARHDWRIFTDLGRRLERLMPERVGRYRAGTSSLFASDSPEAVWNEHRASTRGRDLDITGMSYALLEREGPQQWPMPEGASTGRARLYENGHFATPSGKAQFAAVVHQPPREVTDAEYPFALNTGRLRDQWHGMSRTGTLGRLFAHVSEPAVELHPEDMRQLSLGNGELVRVRSRRGDMLIPARSSEVQRPRQAYIPMHWGEEFIAGTDAQGQHWHGINAVTQPAFCPTSRQPELKHAAVSIDPANLPWQLIGMCWLDQARALSLRNSLMAQGRSWAYANAILFGREPEVQGRVGVMLRLAAAAPPAASQRLAIEQLFGMSAATAMRYDDPVQHQSRCIRLHAGPTGDRYIEAFVVAGEGVAEPWLRPLLERQEVVTALGMRLLSASPPDAGSGARRAAQICSCFDISDQQITSQLQTCRGSEDDRLSQLQAELKCGTNCGSCIPALRKLIRITAPTAGSDTAYAASA